MSLKMDLSEVEAWEAGDILPPGRHPVKVTEAKETESSGGKPQLELQLEAIGGDHKGGAIRDWITFTPAAAGRVKQVLGALGIDVDGVVEVEAENLIGRQATIVVRTELYDGKDRSKVMAYDSPGEQSAAQSNGKSDDEKLPF